MPRPAASRPCRSSRCAASGAPHGRGWSSSPTASATSTDTPSRARSSCSCGTASRSSASGSTRPRHSGCLQRSSVRRCRVPRIARAAARRHVPRRGTADPRSARRLAPRARPPAVGVRARRRAGAGHGRAAGGRALAGHARASGALRHRVRSQRADRPDRSAVAARAVRADLARRSGRSRRPVRRRLAAILEMLERHDAVLARALASAGRRRLRRRRSPTDRGAAARQRPRRRRDAAPARSRRARHRLLVARVRRRARAAAAWCSSLPTSRTTPQRRGFYGTYADVAGEDWATDWTGGRPAAGSPCWRTPASRSAASSARES